MKCGAHEAFVASQRGEERELLPDRYDDDGHSGGNTELLALRRLLVEAKAGRVSANPQGPSGNKWSIWLCSSEPPARRARSIDSTERVIGRAQRSRRPLEPSGEAGAQVAALPAAFRRRRTQQPA